MTRKAVDVAGSGDDDEEAVRYTVLSHKAIALWAVLIVVAGAGLAVWLLLAYGGDPRLQLDAIRTAGTIVVGAGGAAVLLLAARRQRTAEIALKQKDRDLVDVALAHALQERIAAETRAHQERVAAATEHDAAERRVTELYTAAAAQLGSDKAPVRLAGLYALERLAQDNSLQQQTVVNVLCAYLRMPYTLPGEHPGDSADEQLLATHRGRVEEREVRLTAQRVLIAHLRPGDAVTPADTFWADTDLDLTGAVLINVDLRRCRLRTARFIRTQFAGNAMFDEAEFADDTSFGHTKFADNASFGHAKFAGYAVFGDAEFAGDTSFGEAEFADDTSFAGAKFVGDAWFGEAKFVRDTLFSRAKFAGSAWFGEAKFTGKAWFDGAEFAGRTRFDEVEFAGLATFEGAEFAGAATFEGVTFVDTVPTEVERFWSPREDTMSDADAGP